MQVKKRWEIIYNQINGAYISGVCEGIRDETSGGESLPRWWSRPMRRGTVLVNGWEWTRPVIRTWKRWSAGLRKCPVSAGS